VSDPSIETVLLDFGGVFTTSPFDALRSMEDELGASFADLLPIVFGEYDRDTDHPWHCVERGEISFEEASARVTENAATLGFEVDLMTILVRMGGEGGGIREDVVERVRSVRAAGFRTALITNNVREFSALWRATVPVDELFDAVVDSSEVGLRKPDPRIYELALELVDSEASGAVFLDDFEGNVRAAERLGITGILVESDYRPAFDELERVLSLRSPRSTR
jgi:putative hydrolase of the HAD superfamily